MVDQQQQQEPAQAAGGQQELTEHEAAIYDRQLRVWGVETQKRLSAARVLIAGCTGLAAEVAKNIVLAGVGLVTLADDTPCSQRPLSNFLIAGDTPADTTVAEACVATLQEMNPLIKVSAFPGPLAAALQPDALRQHDLLLLCGQPAGTVAAADAACRGAGVAFYAGACRGIYGWAFADLGQEHRYVVEKKEEQEDGSVSRTAEERSEQFASWEEAVGCGLKGVSIKRLSKLYLVLRAAARFEQQHGRFPTAADTEQLSQLWAAEAAEVGVDAGALPSEALAAYASGEHDMPAINAVVGGVVANDLIKAVGRKGEPINNLFLFSLVEGSGAVERMGGQPPAAAPAAAKAEVTEVEEL